jgi:hypothetical protein
VYSEVNASPDLQVVIAVSIQCVPVDVGGGFPVVSVSVLGLPHPGINKKSKKSTSIIFSLTRATMVLKPPEKHTPRPTIMTIIIIIVVEDDIQFTKKIISWYLNTTVHGMGAGASKIGKQIDDIPGTGGSGGSITFRQVDNPDTLIRQVKEVNPNAFSMTKENKVIISREGFSDTAWSNLQNIAKQYNATSIVDGGKVVANNITWTRAGIVAGGVVVAVILIDPLSGAAIGQGIGNIGSGIIQPLIPSLVSLGLPLSFSVSIGLAMMMMMQKM